MERPETERKPFLEHCEKVAKQYGLTPRETEVMILVAKGRTITRIQEELFISRGTAATHKRHIFKKMHIHDKQELLDLLERKESNSEDSPFTQQLIG